MDITGSIADITVPLSSEAFGSFDGIGSSAVDTVVGFALALPNILLGLVASFGADLGSTAGDVLG